MRRQNESIGQLLLKLPWCVGVVLGVIIFVTVRLCLPARAGNDNLRQHPPQSLVQAVRGDAGLAVKEAINLHT